MINLWYHQIHRRIKNGQKCNCEYSIHCCLIEAKRKWKKQFISIESAIRHFTSLNLKLLNIMSLKNEKKKKLHVINFLKDKKNN